MMIVNDLRKEGEKKEEDKRKKQNLPKLCCSLTGRLVQGNIFQSCYHLATRIVRIQHQSF